MKRNLLLIKKILLKIENDYMNTSLMNIGIEGYNLNQIANHCELLFEEGLLSKYNPRYGGDHLLMFTVGNLTNEGFNYLDTIRDTDNLESHKSFNVLVNSTVVGDHNKISDSKIGDEIKWVLILGIIII